MCNEPDGSESSLIDNLPRNPNLCEKEKKLLLQFLLSVISLSLQMLRTEGVRNGKPEVIHTFIYMLLVCYYTVINMLYY